MTQFTNLFRTSNRARSNVGAGRELKPPTQELHGKKKKGGRRRGKKGEKKQKRELEEGEGK